MKEFLFLFVQVFSFFLLFLSFWFILSSSPFFILYVYNITMKESHFHINLSRDTNKRKKITQFFTRIHLYCIYRFKALFCQLFTIKLFYKLKTSTIVFLFYNMCAIYFSRYIYNLLNGSCFPSTFTRTLSKCFPIIIINIMITLSTFSDWA